MSEIIKEDPAQAARLKEQKILQEAIRAVSRCVVVVLQGERRDRFARAEQLARLARELQSVTSTRVDDFLQQQEDEYGLYGNGLAMPQRAGGRLLGVRPLAPAFNDQADLMREAIMALGDQANKNMAQELCNLVEARRSMVEQAMDCTEVDARIASIREQLNKKKGPADAKPADDVVHP